LTEKRAGSLTGCALIEYMARQVSDSYRNFSLLDENQEIRRFSGTNSPVRAPHIIRGECGCDFIGLNFHCRKIPPMPCH
ncbi:MAG: hypothetical protein KDA74_14685, partial [Planctomycetaceae bacterium]|nr:hypothetical protein [Planctomycetaceae bacterium]